MRISAWSIGVSLGLSLFLMAPEGRAELQRVEAVGIYGIRDSMRSRVIPRDEAVAKARWEGVSRVALEMIGESAAAEPLESMDEGGPASQALDAEAPTENDLVVLRKALGDDVLPYMRSYRILDDRGEVPVLFNDEPDVAVEYVVVVEVIVDVDRVTSALANAGLIAAADPRAARESITLELVGLTRFEALQLVLDALTEQYGATRVQTVEFTRGRQVVVVEGPFGPQKLMQQLSRFEDPRLALDAVGIDAEGRRIRVSGRWFAESDADRAPKG